MNYDAYTVDGTGATFFMGKDVILHIPYDELKELAMKLLIMLELGPSLPN